MLAIFRYLLSSAVMSHPHLHRRPSPPARPACLSAAALSARFRANFSARILPLGSTLAWRYTLFLEIWFVSWLTVSFLLAAAISQRIPPRCAAKKRLACPFFRTNSPLLTLILFGLDKLQIMPGCPCLGGWQIVKIHLSFSILRLLMLLLRLYTDLSVCSAIVGASYAGVPCPGALVANLSKSQLSLVDFLNIYPTD